MLNRRGVILTVAVLMGSSWAVSSLFSSEPAQPVNSNVTDEACLATTDQAACENPARASRGEGRGAFGQGAPSETEAAGVERATSKTSSPSNGFVADAEAEPLRQLLSRLKQNSSQKAVAAVQELLRLDRCYRDGSCSYPETEVQSYSDALRDDVLKNLKVLQAESSQGQVPVAAAAEAASYFMAFPDDDVKETSLQILAMAPANAEQARAIIKGLKESVSAPLYHEGLKILRQQVSPDVQTDVDVFVLKTIARGGHFVSQEVARQSLVFINASNQHLFQELLTRLPSDSKASLYLKLNLQEFQRRSHGG